jgi:hypothetical protein
MDPIAHPPAAALAPELDADDIANWPEFEGVPYDPDAIPFDAVPRQRVRKRGWSAGRQRFFIFALSRCGSVALAAKAVGMSARTAYRLADAPGAGSFVAAWDTAIEEGFARIRGDVLQRALGGSFVPVFRRGRLVRVEHRHCNRLAMSLLTNKDRAIDDLRRTAVSRREYRQDLAAHDARIATELRERKDAAAAYQAELEALLEREAERQAREPRGPRIRRL